MSTRIAMEMNLILVVIMPSPEIVEWLSNIFPELMIVWLHVNPNLKGAAF
jgi:hypothetical protein